MQIFVYGTLKPGERNYPTYCDGKATEATLAYTWGQLYHLSLGYPAMAVGDTKVEGILLTFIDESALERLDELESYSSDRPSCENKYERKKIPIYRLSGEFLTQAWGYLMTLEKIKFYQGVLISSGWWTDNSEQ